MDSEEWVLADELKKTQSGHHNDAWVEGGYLTIDQMHFLPATDNSDRGHYRNYNGMMWGLGAVTIVGIMLLMIL